MSLQDRAFFILDASDESGPLWLRCRRLTVREATALGELVARTRAAYTPTAPADLDGLDDDLDGEETESGEEKLSKVLSLLDAADGYAVKLVRGYAETESAPTDAAAWIPCRLVMTEAEVDTDDGLVWVESLAPMIRQEVMVQALQEVGEARKRVARFRSRDAAAAGDSAA